MPSTIGKRKSKTDKRSKTGSKVKSKVKSNVKFKVRSKVKSKLKKKNKVTQLQSDKEKRVRMKYKERNYTSDQLKEAIEGVQEGQTVREAAKKFGIPKSTLHLKLSNPALIDCKKGPSPILNVEEETEIEKWAVQCAENGFPVTKNRLLDSVQLYVSNENKKTPFKDNRPGKQWYNAFLHRHQNLSIRKAQNLTTARASVTVDELKQWFDRVEVNFRDKNLLSLPPERIFNLDESSFRLVPPNDPVIAKKGSKSVYQIVSNNEKATLSVLFTANASGQLLPPMMLFDTKNIPKKNVLESIPKHWSVGNTDQGWMTAESFYGYMKNVFYKWLIDNNYKFPVILYVDGHASHLSLPLSEFCKEKQIELVALFPNATHILQPLDVALFHVLKTSYKSTLTKWRIEKNVVNVKKCMFAPVLQLALENTDYSECIKSGFRTCGLFPFDPEAIDYNVLNKNTKKSKNSQSIEEPRNLIEKNENEKLLDFFEQNVLSNDVLEAFKANVLKESWSGDIKYLELFESWRKMKRLSDNVGEENMVVQEIFDNEMRLPNIKIVEVPAVDSISNPHREKNLDDIVNYNELIDLNMEIDSRSQTAQIEIISEEGQIETVPVLVLESQNLQNTEDETLFNECISAEVDLSKDSVCYSDMDANNNDKMLSKVHASDEIACDSNFVDEYQDSILDLSITGYCKTDFSNANIVNTTKKNLFEIASGFEQNECLSFNEKDQESVVLDHTTSTINSNDSTDEQPTSSKPVNNLKTSTALKDIFTVPSFKSNKKRPKITTHVAVVDDLIAVLNEKEEEKRFKEAQVQLNKQKREKIRQIKAKEQEIKKRLNNKCKENRLKLKNCKKLLKSGGEKENKNQLEAEILRLETEFAEYHRLKLAQQMETLQSQIQIKQEKL